MGRALTKPKRVAGLPLDKWMLLDEVFLNVLTRLGSSELTAGDLRRALVSGQLQAATRCTSTGECMLLPSAFWQDYEVHGFDSRRSFEDPPAFIGARVRRAGAWDRIYGLVFFVRRLDYEKLYPPAGPPPPPPPPPPPIPQGSRRGRPLIHRWGALGGMLAQRCRGTDGKIQPQKNMSEAISDIMNWYSKCFEEIPDRREVEKFASEFFKYLNEKQE